jgi:hypothetical protein
VIALVVGAAQAEEARAAGCVEAPEHTVADAHPRDVLPGGEDRADELVADREAGLDPDAAVVDMQVRPADAARLDLHDRVIAGLELGLGPILDADLAGGLEGDGSHGRCVMMTAGDIRRRPGFGVPGSCGVLGATQLAGGGCRRPSSSPRWRSL